MHAAHQLVGDEPFVVILPDVLVDATGARCDLFDGFGFDQLTVLRSQRALGLVIHFVNGKTPEEKAAIDYSLSPAFRGYMACGVENTAGRPDVREQVEIAAE